jgi:hypothetical protein
MQATWRPRGPEEPVGAAIVRMRLRASNIWAAFVGPLAKPASPVGHRVPDGDRQKVGAAMPMYARIPNRQAEASWCCIGTRGCQYFRTPGFIRGRGQSGLADGHPSPHSGIRGSRIILG